MKATAQRPNAAQKRELLRPGENCWRICHAKQASILIDAENYFRSIFLNLQKAQRHIFILGWDFDSRISLIPGKKKVNGVPTTIDAFLNFLVERNPDLEIHILSWDFSPIFTLDREMFQSLKFRWTAHARIHFQFDNQHPMTASQHQKIVVVDNQIAYCGGIDLTSDRWDTNNHSVHDPLRVNTKGKAYPPFHDVQMLLEGEAAEALGQICRDRWYLATGKRVVAKRPPRNLSDYCFPEPRIAPVRCGIARTLPAYKDNQEVREVERLFIDSIKLAESFLYFENQYFTADSVSQALAESLQRPEGPHIMVVLPIDQTGILAKIAMRNLSLKIAKKLMDVDRYGRFHIYSPIDRNLPKGRFRNIHSKVTIVDFEYIRIGSANLNNRSMGLDTECDVIIDAKNNHEAQEKIRAYFAHVMSEFTPLKPKEVIAELDQGSFFNTLQAQSSSNQNVYLIPHLQTEPGVISELVKKVEIFDLNKSTRLERLLDRIFFKALSDRRFLTRKLPAGLVLTFILSMILGLLVSRSSEIQTLAALMPTTFEGIWGSRTLGLLLLGLLFFIPLNAVLLIVATLVPAKTALQTGIVMVLVTALFGYAVGRTFKETTLRRWLKTSSSLLQRRISQSKTLDMFLLRFFPLAPFNSLNISAGHYRFPLPQYIWGTILGTTPGLVAIVFYQETLVRLLSEPSWPNFWAYFAMFGVITLAYEWLVTRFINSPKERHAADV